VHTDGVATSPLADVSMTKALPPEVQQMMQLSIENGYKRFITLVANARNSTPERSTRSPRATSGPGRCESQRAGRQPGRFDDAVAKPPSWRSSNSGISTTIRKSRRSSMVMDSMSGSVRAMLPAGIAGVSACAGGRGGGSGESGNDKLAAFNDPQTVTRFA
jgi:protease-4